MREIEAKVLKVNEKHLLKRLKELGAKKLSSRKISSIYFDFPNKSLFKAHKVLRLRLDGKKTVLCIKTKKRKSRLKDLEEHEVEAGSFKKTASMLKLLGLKETVKSNKTRTSFRLGPATIELEKISGIPTFIEIEAPSKASVVLTSKRLGFSEKQLLPWNAFDVLKHYKKL